MPHNESILTARAVLRDALDTPSTPAAADLVISALAHLRGALRELGDPAAPEHITLDRWEVRKAAGARGITATQLAERFDKSKETIRRWIRDEQWSYTHAVQLAEMLGVDLAELRK